MKSKFPLLAACLGLGLSACMSVKNHTPESTSDKPIAKGPTLVGRIASVPPDKHFVLVQRYGKWEGQSGQILTTRGPENRTANLRTTGEKLGEFAAADIQAGTVEIGDAVYLQHIPKPVATAPNGPETAIPGENPNTTPTVAATVEEISKNN